MELEILKLIYDYSKKRKLVDTIFIDKLIDIVVQKKGLHDYVKNVAYSNEVKGQDEGITCAGYQPFTKSISIYFQAIKYVLEKESRYDILFSEIEKLIFRNITITQFILHEVEHADQMKKKDNKEDNTIETKIIKASFVFDSVLNNAISNPNLEADIQSGKISLQRLFSILSLRNKYYSELYRFNPIERLAQINSYSTIVNSLDKIKNYIPALYEFNYASFVQETLKGYSESWDGYSCPTEAYLKGTKQDQVWQEISTDFGQHTYAKRLQLGLPVNYHEYEQTFNWLQNTNKFRN